MINVSAGIIHRDGAVLFSRRRADVPYPLTWEFPGGKLTPGETAEQCLRRELCEELGIEATVGELFHRESHVYPEAGSFDVSFFLVSAVSGAPPEGVFDGCRWVPLKDLPSFDTLEGNRNVVAKLTTSYVPATSFAR